MNLHLVHLLPDPQVLSAWATRHRLLSPDGDEGYALHALLTATFGTLAPKPFRYLGHRRGLLAYTDTPADQLQELATLAAPDIAQALGLSHFAARPFPTAWRTGHQLGFEVRARPILRTTLGRERDAYLQAIEGNDVGDKPPSRETVYLSWLERQLTRDQAAELIQANLVSFRLSRVVRRGTQNEGGHRRLKTPSGPDVVFKGILRVTSGDAFTSLLARGVGRHRAFGFGMLLLTPASSC